MGSKAAFTRHNNSIHGAHPVVKEETTNNLSQEAQPSDIGDVSRLTASNSKDLLRCQPCDKEFKTKVGLTRHNNSIHGAHPVVKEETTNNLSHEAQPSDTGDVSCLTKSNRKDLLRCQPCDKEVKTKAGLTRHNKSHHSGQPINVSIKTTSWKESSKAVKMSVIEKMDKVLSPMFQCPTCSKEFKEQRYLTNHQKTHQTSKIEKLAKDRQRKGTQRMDPNYRKEEAEKSKDAMSKKRKDDPNYRKKEADAISKIRKD